jgi:hypothetical protein
VATDDQIKKFLDAYPDLEIETLYRMLDGDRRDRRRGNMPRRQMALENAEYAAKAESLRVGEGIKTSTRAECVGIIRALDRQGRMGCQRTINKELWAWRIK